MQVTQKFFVIVGLVLVAIAMTLTAYGVYFVQSFVPTPEYPTCGVVSGYCGPLTLQWNIFATIWLASLGFGILALWQALDMSMHPRRYQRRGC